MFVMQKQLLAAMTAGLILALPLGAAQQKADLLREKAEAGDAESAFYLGNEYYYGEHRKINYTLAAYWYLKAAEKGIPEAQYNYAACLESGRGVKINLPEAFSWYQKAAKQDFEPALFRVAKIYASGLHDGKTLLLHPEPKTALELLEKLADRKFEPAEIELAAMRMGRSDSAENHRQAFTLLSRVNARKNAQPEATRMLADCYFSGIGCPQDRQKAVELLKSAAAGGDAEALAKLGFLFEFGNTVKADPVQAHEYYRQAAEKGHPMGQFKYAEAMAEGAYPGKNLNDAVEWYRKSAGGGCQQAMFKLGVMYHDGLGVKVDKARAAAYFFQAARRGYARAQYNLACMFDEGTVTGKPDKEAAFYWFLQAARGGDTVAQRRTGICYMNGIGVERSISKAEQWLVTAARNGDFAARELLYQIQQSGPGPAF
ncbi:MAG: sel1 repeat family protein [Lentisphaeria bacterium]|nr:sel1 repeat family protein [Lentisphaeria bacterium]